MNNKNQNIQNGRSAMNNDQYQHGQQGNGIPTYTSTSQPQQSSSHQQNIQMNISQQESNNQQQQMQQLYQNQLLDPYMSLTANSQQQQQQPLWPYQTTWQQMTLGVNHFSFKFASTSNQNSPQKLSENLNNLNSKKHQKLHFKFIKKLTGANDSNKEFNPNLILNNPSNIPLNNLENVIQQQQQQQQPTQNQMMQQTNDINNCNSDENMIGGLQSQKQQQLMNLLNGANNNMVQLFPNSQQNYMNIISPQIPFSINNQKMNDEQYKLLFLKLLQNSRGMEAEGSMLPENGQDNNYCFYYDGQTRNQIGQMLNQNNIRQNPVEYINNEEEQNELSGNNKKNNAQQVEKDSIESQRNESEKVKSRKKCKNKRMRDELEENSEDEEEMQLNQQQENQNEGEDEIDEDDDEEEEDNEQDIKEMRDINQFSENNKMVNENEKYNANKPNKVGTNEEEEENKSEQEDEEQEGENLQGSKQQKPISNFGQLNRNFKSKNIMKSHISKAQQKLFDPSYMQSVGRQKDKVDSLLEKPHFKKTPIQKIKKQDQIIKNSYKKDSSNSKNNDNNSQSSSGKEQIQYPPMINTEFNYLNQIHEDGNLNRQSNNLLQLQQNVSSLSPIHQNENARNRPQQSNQAEQQQNQATQQQNELQQSSNNSPANLLVSQQLRSQQQQLSNPLQGNLNSQQLQQIRIPQNSQLISMATGFLNNNQAQILSTIGGQPQTNQTGTSQIIQINQQNQNAQTQNTDRAIYNTRPAPIHMAQIPLQGHQQNAQLPFQYNFQITSRPGLPNNQQQQQQQQSPQILQDPLNRQPNYNIHFNPNMQQIQQLYTSTQQSQTRPTNGTNPSQVNQLIQINTNGVFRNNNNLPNYLNGIISQQQPLSTEVDIPLDGLNPSSIIGMRGQQIQIQQSQQQQQLQQLQLQQQNKNNSNQAVNRSQVQKQNHLPLEVKNKYYTYRHNQPPQDYDTTEPYMKITVMKTNQDNANQNNVYYITPKGMVKSKKSTATDDIIIGRQESYKQQEPNRSNDPLEIRPNDIVLPPTDRAISRIHCKIIYKDGFRIPRQITDTFKYFLYAIKKNTIIPNYQIRIPDVALRLIWKFVRPKNAFYIVDIGSAQGTFIKIRYEKSQVIEKGQVFLIGAETQFHILEVNHSTFLQKEDKYDHGEENPMGCESLSNMIGDENEFMQYLLYEKKQNINIHGLTAEENQKLEAMFNQPDGDGQNNTTQLVEYKKNFKPYVKLKVNSTQISYHLFVLSQQACEQGYKIGRSQECTIQININTISRKQSRIFYSKGKWQLKDGDMNRESANGTWISLNDYREKTESRYESDPKEIEDGSEIKISDSILKIEICNNEVKKAKPKYSFTLDHLDEQMDVEPENNSNNNISSIHSQERQDLDVTG